MRTSRHEPELQALAFCYCLAIGPWHDAQALYGTLCASYAEVLRLQADRRANGEDFPDERPMAVWAAACDHARCEEEGRE